MSLIRISGTRVSAFAIVLMAAFGSSALAADYVQNELLVQFSEGAKRDRKSINSVYRAAGVEKVRRYTGMMQDLELWTVNGSSDLRELIAEVNAQPGIAFAQPNYILRAPRTPRLDLLAAAALEGEPCLINLPFYKFPKGCDPTAEKPPSDGGCWVPGIPLPPGCEGDPLPTPPARRPDVQPAPADVAGQSDPRFKDTYGMNTIRAPKAWSQWKGAKEMIVAVIDTGVDYNHEDLAFNMWRNPNPKNGDIVGYDFVHNDGLPYDDNEHGSHCAGVIGATGENGVGLAGVNHRVSIMALKFLTGEGSGTTADAIRAIDYAVENGAKVLSNSWGGPADEENPALEKAIERSQARDVLFIAAAGNETTNNDTSGTRSYPASFGTDNIVSVAATNIQDKLAFFSNYGEKTTHLAAPGVNILSTTPQNTYRRLSGTSMAAPHVAGAAALVWSKHPTWTYREVKAALLSTVDPVEALKGKVSTAGRLNVEKALGYSP